MKKSLEIKVKLDYEFTIVALPNAEHWEEAPEEHRREYMRERVREFLEDQMDDILEDLLDKSKITY